jgi:outer membrane protein TolC
VVLAAGCSATHYRNAADREVYGLIERGETNALGKRTGFRIDTPYSMRDPQEIKAGELVQERAQGSRLLLTIEDALRLAIANSRTYQRNKETLYLTALNLTREQFEFSPQLFASSVGTLARDPNQSQSARLSSRVGVDQLLKSGARLSAVLANDILTYYVGQNPRSALSSISVNLVQPLLRGAGARIVAENLTQAERNLIYEIRAFNRFQMTFAVDIVISYLRLLQQKDVVRNEYNSYVNAISARELSEALGVDRLARVQVDQARQRELDSRNRYFLAVERYRDQLDAFKGTLALPLSTDLQLDDKALDDLKAVGLMPANLAEQAGYAVAVQKRLDLLNEIDRFEDTKRKIAVACNQLRTQLDFFASASLDSDEPTDYTKFTWDKYRATAGFRLNLPLARLPERNVYRTTFINFERQLRTLAQALDDVRDDVRQGIRGLELARRTYEVQQRSVQLADQRVESTDMLFQAGRVQIRDLLESQDAQLRAQNAFTLALIEYHSTRLGLLRDLNVLDPDDEKFWLKDYPLPTTGTEETPALLVGPGGEVITPDKLFGNN